MNEEKYTKRCENCKNSNYCVGSERIANEYAMCCLLNNRMHFERFEQRPLHLVLTRYWYDKVKIGEKRVEYRALKPFWIKRIKGDYNVVTFHRAYTSETISFKIDNVDIGFCPYENWNGVYIRIHFSEKVVD